MRSATCKVWSINLPISRPTFACTTCLLAGGLKQRTITQRGRERDKVKNHWSKVKRSLHFTYQCIKQSDEHQGPAFQSYLHATETCFLVICIRVQNTVVINFLFNDKRKVVHNEFELIKRSLQVKTWFHPLLHFSLVMLGILLSTLLDFFLEKFRFAVFSKKEQNCS